MYVYDSSYVREHDNQSLTLYSTVRKRKIAFFVITMNLKNVPIFRNVSSHTVIDKSQQSSSTCELFGAENNIS